MLKTKWIRIKLRRNALSVMSYTRLLLQSVWRPAVPFGITMAAVPLKRFEPWSVL